jgi:hypothetical protein
LIRFRSHDDKAASAPHDRNLRKAVGQARGFACAARFWCAHESDFGQSPGSRLHEADARPACRLRVLQAPTQCIRAIAFPPRAPSSLLVPLVPSADGSIGRHASRLLALPTPAPRLSRRDQQPIYSQPWAAAADDGHGASSHAVPRERLGASKFECNITSHHVIYSQPWGWGSRRPPCTP